MLLRKKSASEKAMLIKKIEDIFFSQKFPINVIGNEKNRGIRIIKHIKKPFKK